MIIVVLPGDISTLRLNRTLATGSGTVLPNMFPLSITENGSEVQAPVIVIGPKDTTVVAGIQATLECVANARYVYLVLYLCIIHLFIHSFTHTHTHPVTYQVNFSSHISREAKIKHFKLSAAKHIHTEWVYCGVGVLTSQSFLSFLFSQTAANYASVRNRQKLNQKHVSAQLNI